MHGLSRTSLGKTKYQRNEEVNDLVLSYKKQRSFGTKNKSSSNTLGSFEPLNLSWDCNLDSNVVIKTEKDFDSPNVVRQDCAQSVPPADYFQWCKMKDLRTGDKNSVSFSSMMTDSSSYEEQYLSLKIFLAACSHSYKKELSSILFPMFVHFYLDLINKPDSNAAQSFYTKFHNDHEESHKDVLHYLPQITTQNKLVLFPMVHELRKTKMLLKLSPHIYSYFLQHLRHGNYSLILQNMNRYFSIKLSTFFNNGLCISENDQTVVDSDVEFRNNATFQPTNSEDQNAIDCLQKSITELKKCTKILKPSICVYTFSNVFQGLSASSFSNKSTQLVAGFEDSSVRVWSITPKGKILDGEGDKNTDSNDLCTLRGHHGPVYQTKFFPNDDFLISSSQDKSVRLWNLYTQKGVVEYRGHAHTVWDVDVNRNGTYFVSGSLDRTLRLWNTEYAFPLRIFSGHTDSVDSVAFHPNGNYIASGSSDKSCRLWDLQSGQFVRVFVGHKAPIYALAFSPDGKYLLSSGDDTDIKIWDLSNAQLLNELKGSQKTVYSLSFSEDASMLACSGLYKSISVYESELLFKKKNSLFKSTIASIGTYETKANSVLSLKFSTGNLLLASCVTR